MVNTVIVNGYNVKFDKTSISIPGAHSSIVNGRICDDFIQTLTIRGWKPAAIKQLQSYIGSENQWRTCVNMSIKSGKIIDGFDVWNGEWIEADD